MCKSVQVCTKPPWCQERGLMDHQIDICNKSSMLSNGHFVIECSVTAPYSYGCAYQLCFNSAEQTSRVSLCGYKEKLIEYKSN